MMRQKLVYTIGLVAFLVCLSTPLSAQKRIDAPSESRGLPAKNSKFTIYDRKKTTDNWGLHKSQFHGEHHEVGAYVMGGYSTSFPSSSAISFKPGGYDLRLGVIYELCSNYFLFQTGVGIAYRSIRLNVDDYRFTNYTLAQTGEEGDARWNTIIDTDGMRVDTLTYTSSGRQDAWKRCAIQVPVLFGAHISDFYALGGFNFSLPVWQKATQTMDISSQGLYKRYYGDWVEMDNHGYRQLVPTEQSAKDLKPLFDIQIMAEVGYEHAIAHSTYLRVAAYVSYGLLNEARKASDPAIDIPYDSKWDFGTFQTNPVWKSNLAEDSKLHDFSVGIKVTVLYQFRQPDKCILCGLRGKH